MEKTKELMKVKALLEKPEIDYAMAIFNQLEEHMNNLHELASEANRSKDHNDLLMLFLEVERTSERTETLFNLGDSLLRKANENVKGSLKELNNIDFEKH